jgi:hypothetical protein
MVERMARRFDGRLLFGLVLLTLGVLFTLDNLNVLESEGILQWWPAIFLLVGLCKLFGIGTSRHLVWGVVFSVVGFFLLGDSLGQWDFDIWNFWPVILIFVGGSLLARGFSRRPVAVPGAPGGAAPDVDAELRSFAFMSGVTRKIMSSEFRGGELSAVMGGVELDLRQAKLNATGAAVIEVFVWWGGIDIRVPEGWSVANEGLAIMGAVEDSTKVPGDGKQTLIIRGLVMMGGVEIKN